MRLYNEAETTTIAGSFMDIVANEQTLVLAMVGIYLDGCPQVVESDSTCKNPASVVVYEGDAMSTHDGGLLAFTCTVKHVLNIHLLVKQNIVFYDRK